MINFNIFNKILVVCLFMLLTIVSIVNAAEKPSGSVPNRYIKYFKKYQNERSLFEKAINTIGLSKGQFGPGFALVVGISNYINIAPLTAAKADIDIMFDHLDKVQKFDQIIVLQNEDVNADNLDYFLTEYLPKQLYKHPKSRFLFSFSGHGMTISGKRGYLLKHNAESLNDRFRAFEMTRVKKLLMSSIREAHQSLVLINACYSGAFLVASFGKEPVVPIHPGAHAILASSSGELSWSHPDYGERGGSIFFEALIKGLSTGEADQTSYLYSANKPDGIITFTELAAYLDSEIKGITNQGQNPVYGPLIINKKNGGFFFLSPNSQLVLKDSDNNISVKISEGMSSGITDDKKIKYAPGQHVVVNSKITRFILLNSPIYKPGEYLILKISTNSSNVRAFGLFESKPGRVERVQAKFNKRYGGVYIPYEIPVDAIPGIHAVEVYIQEIGTSNEERHNLNYEILKELN